MLYNYVAYSKRRIARGRAQADSPAFLEEALAHEGLRVLQIKPVFRFPTIEEALPSLFRPKRAEVITFSRQLATLLECGISLVPALQILRRQVKGRRFKQVITAIEENLGKGLSFSEAIGRHPQVFNQLYCRMAAVGERSGQLEQALKQVAAYMEKQALTMKKLTKTMTYPALVLLLAIGVVGILFTVALPPMLGVFESFGAKLPPTTGALIFLTHFVSGYRMPLLLAMAGVVVLGGWSLRQPWGKRLKDRLLLRLPLIGPLILAGEVARFCRIVGMLLKAGVSMPETMELVQEASSNGVIKEGLGQVQKNLLQGKGLSGPLGSLQFFPPLFIQMVAVGEETATLDSTLIGLADVYETEVDDRVNTLMTSLEPAMTIAIAGVVGFIAISMITPMYSVLGQMK